MFKLNYQWPAPEYVPSNRQGEDSHFLHSPPWGRDSEYHPKDIVVNTSRVRVHGKLLD